jgi:hypothetical protein
MKFYDRIMSDSGAIPIDPRQEWIRPDHVISSMRSAVVVDASNVAKYISKYGFDPGTIPSWTPPFEYTWFETSKVNTPTDRYDDEEVYQQVGALVHRREYDTRTLGGDCRWALFWTIFVLQNNRVKLHRAQQHLEYFVYEDGRSDFDYGEEYGQTEAVHYLAPFLMAIGFSHCKNVEIIDGPMPPIPIRRKQERKLGAPLIKYKELIIDPSMTQKRYAEPRYFRDDEKHQKALHIARGHFAHYTEDKPLFGKYAGTFWRPAHVRGSAEVGTVYKDYKVKAA